MKKLLKHLRDNKIWFDVLNILLGLGIIVLIVLFTLFPTNPVLLLLVLMLAGIMNLSNGFKMLKLTPKKNAGMCFIMIGAIILFMAVLMIT